MPAQEATPELREHDEAVIRDLLGDSVVDRLRYVDEGWDSRVYVVGDGEVVFKFPRVAAVKEQYRHEIAALKLLEGVEGTVRTPRVKWEAPDLAYFGYEGIRGRQLSQLLPGLDDEAKGAFGALIGAFLRGLHGLDLPGAPTWSIDDDVASYEEKYHLALPALNDAFSRSELARIEAWITGYLPAELRRLGADLVLGHGDIGPWNMIVTPDHALGLIDFGEVGYHDRAKDFAGILDRAVLDAAVAAYGGDGLLREKAELRRKGMPILDIPFYPDKQNSAGVKNCVDEVRRVIIEGKPVGNFHANHAGG